MKRKLATLVPTGIIIALAIFFGLRPHSADKSVVQLSVARYIAAEGKVEARPGAEMDIGSEMTARIERFLVNEGDHVSKGQVIAILSADELTARLRQAEAELAQARAKQGEVAAGAREQEIKQAQAALQRAQAEQALAENQLKRSRDLHKEQFVSQAVLDNAESAHQVATARVEEAAEYLHLLQAGPRSETLQLHAAQVKMAESNVRYIRALLDKTRVLAPISGTLIERYLDVGEVVIPEKPIAHVADTAQLRINAEVDETDAGRLRLGDPVQISAYAYPGKIYQGRVEEIASYVGKREIKPNNPAVNLGLKIIQVKIAFQEANPLKLGMTVDVRIIPPQQR